MKMSAAAGSVVSADRVSSCLNAWHGKEKSVTTSVNMTGFADVAFMEYWLGSAEASVEVQATVAALGIPGSSAT